MRKMFRKILLSAVIVIVAMCAFSMSTFAADGIDAKINALRSKYPDGYFWNHQVTANSNNGDQLMARWDESFSQSVTSTPCKTHNGTAYAGQYDCNFFDGGIQCYGFARRVFYDIFGVRVSNMTTRYDTNNIQVGDHIRINNNTHSAVVIARNGNTLTLVEANLDLSGAAYNCKIRWGATCDISKVTYFQHASNYDAVRASGEITTPTITLNKDVFYVGEKVNITWPASDKVTDFYQYWVIIQNTTNNQQYYAGATGGDGDYSKNSYEFTIPAAGDYKITVYSVPYYNKDERQKVSTKTFAAKIEETEVPEEDPCAAGHTYTSKVTKAATCSATGVKTYTCSVCEATKTETIAKTAHKFGEYKPSCDFTNFPTDTQVRTCSVCKATQKTTYTMKYSSSNNGVTAGSTYVKLAFDESDFEDIGGVKFYLYDTEAKKYVRVENEKIEKTFDEDTWGYIYKIKGLTANTEYTILTVFYGCWDWEGEPGEKMEDDIVSIKKATVTTLSSDTLGTTSKITATKTATSVTLDWNAVAGAEGYRVYRKIDGEWKKLTETTKLTYTVKSLKANTKYSFAVRAYNFDGETKVPAPKYKTVSATTSKVTLGTTSKITATTTTSSVTLKWNKVAGATGYRVYQKVSGEWKALGYTTKLTYTIKSLKAGTKYDFAVRAYVLDGETKVLALKYKSLAVTTTKASSKPAQVKNLKATPTATTVKLTWSKVSGVKGYEIFSYNSKTKKYTSLGKTTGTTYTVKKLKANTSYQYAVQAYKVSGKKNVYGKVSSVVKVTTLLATPTLKVTTTKGKANLTWNNIAGESGYAIYMATSKNGKYTHLANYKANSTKATKSKLKSGKTYYFKIRAYKKASSKTTYGAYSTVKSVKIK